MDNFLLSFFVIVFTSIPVYNLALVYSVYYKKIYKNKANLKFSHSISSIGIYTASIALGITSIIYIIYSFIEKLNPLFIIGVLFLNILLFFCIKASSSKFYIFNDYLIVKNNYCNFNEIKNIIIEKKEKQNHYEVKITTKSDLLLCTLVTEDSRSILKSLKSNLPKNIKIKEVLVK